MLKNGAVSNEPYRNASESSIFRNWWGSLFGMGHFETAPNGLELIIMKEPFKFIS
jgi:hypothetical protein